MNEEDENDYEPEYELEPISIAGGRFYFQVWSVVPPPLEFLSTLHTNRQEISGRQVWTGSLLLAHVLVQLQEEQPDLFRDQTILELGSGTGILGWTVSRLDPPAACVVLSDGDDKAVELLEQNLAHSFQTPTTVDATSPSPPATTVTNRVRATRLLWGSEEKEQRRFQDWCRASFPSQWPRNTSARETADTTTEPVVQFDSILAGDVMYKESLPKLFFETVQSFLVPNGTCWLCHVPRACVTHEVVVDAAQASGFVVELVPVGTDLLDAIAAANTNCPKEDLSRARVYRITRA